MSTLTPIMPIQASQSQSTMLDFTPGGLANYFRYPSNSDLRFAYLYRHSPSEYGQSVYVAPPPMSSYLT